ncbi:SpoIIE family protein phosphatase [Xanthomonas sp. XNM01]|uniref:SpoIIE family protein phosphatase n=1 Tax=Xanthomonas sp. XNM01 TaxID=2769289 RepID=UPI001CE22B29|nr:SpoIIE family protein phosphatase [Xanthomonas sp. XNM01]
MSTVPGADAAHDPVRIRWRDSLRTRMVAWSSILNALLLLAVALAFYVSARALIVQNARTETWGLAEQAARSLEATVASVEVSGRTLAAAATSVGAEPATLRALLVASLAGDPDIAGAMVIVEPGMRPGDDDGFAWYIRRDGTRLIERSVLDLGYDHRTMPWFVRTLAAPRPWWSEPYANAATGGQSFTTYNLPLRLPGADPGAPAVGMVSLDVPVARLSAQIRGLGGAGLQPMLFSPAGLAVVHPDPQAQMRLSLSEYLRTGGDRGLQPLLDALERRDPVEFHHPGADGHTLMTLAVPVGDSGWTFAASVAEARLLGRLNTVALWVAAVGLGALLLVLWLVRRYTGRLLHPIEALTDSAGHFARGDFDYPMARQARRDEVGVMAQAFDTARTSIKRQLGEIGAMAARQQKLESELSIAREIQQSMLPAGRAFETGHALVEAHALLEPATAVGGDFYQFGELEPGVLWFTVGDVSDKGVPAALFMARAVTVLETQARRHGSPERILAEAANGLSEGNEACMFATVLCGRLDVASGRLQLASAGHEPPLLLHADGHSEQLELDNGPPLGVEPGARYALYTGVLPAGATLIGYTDGVTEAFDVDHRAYGRHRLGLVLSAGDGAATVCHKILRDVRGFAGNAPQSDDITILAIGRRRDVAG